MALVRRSTTTPNCTGHLDRCRGPKRDIERATVPHCTASPKALMTLVMNYQLLAIEEFANQGEPAIFPDLALKRLPQVDSAMAELKKRAGR